MPARPSRDIDADAAPAACDAAELAAMNEVEIAALEAEAADLEAVAVGEMAEPVPYLGSAETATRLRIYAARLRGRIQGPDGGRA